ncbi:helix-turn-helix transcriptional regulator [Nocardia seriolae]|uniref:LuxR family transcriptional regulator n=1 Tax=Nocardia seriolae TaxID=37332 RepID=A0ABC9Z3C1_9NOCA|nr:helix-turn-helix transcriptional regulator [Nocardia seriolae]QOW36038.1 AAA family ATPase [Nocardia seriolae]QUN16466.1 AAA family ATPase [Nocardia seriolae]WKY49982.1 AAA family ATPase [Nocardia seriolae]GAM50025.1 LuxR family transcriptional regulator [Nocardia seriolae]GAP32020.1 LuxR family transcriptional regulator [Nocardia seriolae]
MVSFPGSSVLVGRAAEVSALVESVADPGTHAVLIAGEAGIGKSRLVAEFTGRLAPGALVLIGRCPELGTGGVAFAPFLAVLRGLMRELGVAAVAELLPPRPALANWLPQLAVHTGGAPAETDRIRLFGEILTVLEQLALTRAVVVILEGLHWADDASRDLLTFLAANLTDADALLVGTYRPGEAGPLRGLVAELRRNPGVRVVDLRPLNRHEVGRQLAALLGREPEPALITKVFERSGGNPLFVEALGHAPEDLPSGLTDLLLGFGAGLSPQAHTIVGLAAVIGSPIRHDLLSAAADLPPAELHSALSELVERHLLLPTDTGYEFRHVLIRQAIHDDLLPVERTRLHARLAEILRTETPEPTVTTLAELAHHAQAAGELPRALTATWSAASAAPSHHPERLRLLEQLLSLWDRVPSPESLLHTTKLAVLEQIVEVAVATGATERGIAAADAALAILDPGGEIPAAERPGAGSNRHSGVASAGIHHAKREPGQKPAGMTGEPSAAVQGGEMPGTDMSGSARDRAAPDGPGPGADGTGSERVARLYRRRAYLRGTTGAGPGEDLARALALLPVESPGAERAEALVQSASARIFRGDAVGSAADARAALVIAQRLEADALVARAHAHLGLAGAAAAEVAAAGPAAGDISVARPNETDWALAHFAQAHRVAAAAGDARIVVDVATWESAVLVGAGRYEAAIAAVRQGLRAAHESFRFSESAPILYVKWAQALAALGRWDEARAVVDATQFDELPPLSRAAMLLCFARISLAEGDSGGARTAAIEVERLLGDSRWAAQYRLELVALNCALVLESGDEAAADADLTTLLTALDGAATLFAHPHEAWPLVVLAARITGAPPELLAMGDSLPTASPVDSAQRAVFTARLAGSAARWAEAATAWRTVERPYDVATSLLGLAESAVAEGNRAEAGSALRELTDIATRLGAEPLRRTAQAMSERARIPLDGSSNQPSKAKGGTGSGRFGLTARELDVLRLVAKGLSNRGLAAELFISINTAGVHVSRILAKLGVAGRTEAAAFAHEHGLLAEPGESD